MLVQKTPSAPHPSDDTRFSTWFLRPQLVVALLPYRVLPYREDNIWLISHGTSSGPHPSIPNPQTNPF